MKLQGMCNLTIVCEIRAVEIHSSLVIKGRDIIGGKRAKVQFEDFMFIK